MKKAWTRERARYVPLWKNGGLVEVKQRSGLLVRRKTYELNPALDVERIFAVDTESTRVDGVLVTDLVPMAFHDGCVLIDRLERPNVLVAMLEEISDRFSVPMHRPSRHRQRKKRKRANGQTHRDGRKAKTPISNAVWFNMQYDIGRLFPEHPFLRLIHSGVDSFTMRVDERWSIEWERYIDGSAPQFTWLVRDHKGRRITKVVGTDVTGTWKTSLEKFLKAMGLEGKIPIEDKHPGIHEQAFEDMSEEARADRREYAIHDARQTLAGNAKSTQMLVEIDPCVIRRNGLPPPSAPGAAARIMFARSFKMHPDVEEWRGPPAWADRLGAEAYYGGRSACPLPGIVTGGVTLDLKSAYPAVMAMLPDPVKVCYRQTTGGHFRLEEWCGRFGVLRVSGESLDDVYPAFRVHDGDRLRYVYGPFREVAVTIPEHVVVVLHGALRVDQIHAGFWLDGNADKSFIRDYVLDMYRIKESDPKGAKGKTAKLFITSPYGKLIEVQCQEILCEKSVAVPDVRRHPQRHVIAASMVRCALSWQRGQVRAEDVWLGEASLDNAPFLAEARALFLKRLERIDHEGDPEEVGLRVLECYCRTLAPVLGDLPLAPLRDVVRSARAYKAGRYFMPAYASQITGFTSAQLGLMIASVGARACDTDSSHFVCPTGDPLKVPGVQRYFQIMKAAGYQAPRLDDSSSLIAGSNLGTWAAELPQPSLESVFVRPKRYSHRYVDPEDGKVKYKQATHGMSRFQADPSSGLSKEEAVHEAMRAMLRGDVVRYSTRRAPRKGREAVRTGQVVGEFVSHEVYVRNDPVHNTWVDDQGVVRWTMLGEELLAAAEE